MAAPSIDVRCDLSFDLGSALISTLGSGLIWIFIGVADRALHQNFGLFLGLLAIQFRIGRCERMRSFLPRKYADRFSPQRRRASAGDHESERHS